MTTPDRRRRFLLALLVGILVFAAVALLSSGGGSPGTQEASALQRLLIAPKGLKNANRYLSVKPIEQQAILLDDVLASPLERSRIAGATGRDGLGTWTLSVIGSANALTANVVANASTEANADALARAAGARAVALFADNPLSNYTVEALGEPATSTSASKSILSPTAIVLGFIGALMAYAVIGNLRRDTVAAPHASSRASPPSSVPIAPPASIAPPAQVAVTRGAPSFVAEGDGGHPLAWAEPAAFPPTGFRTDTTAPGNDAHLRGRATADAQVQGPVGRRPPRRRRVLRPLAAGAVAVGAVIVSGRARAPKRSKH